MFSLHHAVAIVASTMLAGAAAGTVTLSNVKLPVDQNGKKLITGEGAPSASSPCMPQRTEHH